MTRRHQDGLPMICPNDGYEAHDGHPGMRCPICDEEMVAGLEGGDSERALVGLSGEEFSDDAVRTGHDLEGETDESLEEIAEHELFNQDHEEDYA